MQTPEVLISCLDKVQSVSTKRLALSHRLTVIGISFEVNQHQHLLMLTERSDTLAIRESEKLTSIGVVKGKRSFKERTKRAKKALDKPFGM